MLAADAKLKVYVVGQTDNVGTLEGSMRLSQERAEAVVQALSEDARNRRRARQAFRPLPASLPVVASIAAIAAWCPATTSRSSPPR